MTSKQQLLLLVIAFTIVTPGCLGTSSPSPSTAMTSTPPSTTSSYEDVELNRTVYVQRAMTDNVTYYESNNTIRYIEEYRTRVNSTTGESTSEPVYGTEDADYWAKHIGTTVAEKVVEAELAAHYSNETLQGITVSARSNLTVAINWNRDTGGETAQTPSIPQETLR